MGGMPPGILTTPHLAIDSTPHSVCLISLYIAVSLVYKNSLASQLEVPNSSLRILDEYFTFFPLIGIVIYFVYVSQLA